MIDKPIENNEVEVLGTVLEAPRYSHQVFDEPFYSFSLQVNRLSDATDQIQVTVSGHYPILQEIEVGSTVHIRGQFRSYNNTVGCLPKLILTVFAREIQLVSYEAEHLNHIFLNGFLCRPPSYRTTPFGREITDLLLAINRQYNKSDYIPCIAWGKNARTASQLNVGSHIQVWGRIQSREYQKRINEFETQSKIAYEISIFKLEPIERALTLSEES